MNKYSSCLLLILMLCSSNGMAATKRCNAWHTHTKDGEVTVIFSFKHDLPASYSCLSFPEILHETNAAFIFRGCTGDTCTFSAPTNISAQEECEVTVQEDEHYGEHML